MSIDYLPLMLINMSAGLVLAAVFLVRGLGTPRQGSFAPAFLAVAAVALATGLAMIFTWPLAGSYNIAFGEPTVLLGAVFLAAGLALWLDVSLAPVGILSALAGLAAIVLGARLYHLHMTQLPELTLVGYVCSGAAAILTLPALFWPGEKVLRWAAGTLMILAAGVWMFTACGGLWMHLEHFAKWRM